MDTKIDFLPERLKAKRSLRRRIIRQVYLLVLVAIGLVVWGYLSRERVADARGELALLRERSAGFDRLLVDKARLQKEQTELLIKERISKQLGSRIDVLDVLGELERILPPRVSLLSLNLDGVQVQLHAGRPGRFGGLARTLSGERGAASATVNRLQLVIRGIAPNDVDIAIFIGHLSASRIFEDVRMGYCKNLVVEDRRAREFQASCHVVR